MYGLPPSTCESMRTCGCGTRITGSVTTGSIVTRSAPHRKKQSAGTLYSEFLQQSVCDFSCSQLELFRKRLPRRRCPEVIDADRDPVGAEQRTPTQCASRLE